jgi:twitching motility protein PilT
MSDFWRDPQLNELVHEINRTESERREPSPLEKLSFPTESPESVEALNRLLEAMSERDASDLLLIPGSKPIMRVHGDLVPTGGGPLATGEVAQLFAGHLQPRRLDELTSSGSADFSIRMARGSQSRRFRVNLHRQRGDVSAAVRSLPAEIPTLENLNLPASLAKLVEPTTGLVLVCGPTGSGKSSTLAALVGEINRRFARHVVSIEDPIEYEHSNSRSVIEQIEIGVDAPSFSAALRSTLRQDPDVILVGEMRDLDTISTALTAAETGHLILATLHTADAPQAIHRIIDVFPPGQQSQIRHQLALSLNAIISQELIPRADKAGRIAAVELLLANDAIRNHIRTDRLQNLASEITLGKRLGMISLDESLATLVRNRVISVEEARMRARRTEELDSLLRG